MLDGDRRACRTLKEGPPDGWPLFRPLPRRQGNDGTTDREAATARTARSGSIFDPADTGDRMGAPATVGFQVSLGSHRRKDSLPLEAVVTSTPGRPLTGDELLRLRSIVASLRARRERLRELLSDVARLEREIDSELVDVQALAAEGNLIVRRHCEAS